MVGSEWTGWELVDIQVLRDVIESASGIEADVVSAAVTDATITCPLPTRLTGMWDRQATHPRLKNFELSDADIEREMQFNRALLKEFMDQQKDLPQTDVTPRGFSDMIFDSRSLQAGLFESDSAYDSAMMTGMYGADDEDYGAQFGAGGFGGAGGRPGATTQANPELESFARELAEQFDDPDEAEGDLQAWIVERATAEGELLLFRYLDFNVQPGYEYKYRVSLELKNPNYGKPISAAAGDLSVTDPATLETDWSNETEPVRVAETVQYFLTEVDESRVRVFPDARMHMYQWDTEIGTIVHDELTIGFGQEIGGVKDVMKINPAQQSREEGEYSFTSNDRLVDAVTDLEFTRAEHPDLQLPQGSRGEAGIVEHALVVQDGRALLALDPVSQAGDRNKQERYIEVQDELYANFRGSGDGEFNPEMGEDGDLTELYQQLYGEGGYDGGYGGDEMEGYGSRPSRRSSLRRGSRGRSSR